MDFLGIINNPVFVLFIITMLPLLYFYVTHPLKMLRDMGVPIVPGAKILIGHMLEVFKEKHAGLYDFNNMNKYGGFFGLCEFSAPVLVISDPNLMKEVLFRQFSSFTDRRPIPLRSWMKWSMFDQKDTEWKRIRAMLTPFFSSGKLKNNMHQMQISSKTLVKNLSRIVEQNGEFEAYKVSGAFTLDVIVSTAFNLRVDSENDSNNPLLCRLRDLSNVDLARPHIFITFVFPFLSPIFELFGISMFPSGYLEFFERTIKKMIDERMHDDQTYPDFLQALIRAHKEEIDHQTRTELGVEDRKCKKGLTDKEIMAQILLFFLAGYDTTATTLSFLLYNLALHPDAQERAAEEIKTVVGDEELTYEKIQKLEYLEMCVCESLRIYPPAYRFDREAAERVNVGPISVPRGCIVVVPVWAVHHNPDFWPSPETFDPQRFSAEERKSQNPLSFIPFGAGSRNCIGSRFAQLEIKIAVVEILKAFRIGTTGHTQIPMEFEKGLFLHSKNGIHLNLQKRI